jgi:DNA methyltransferase 1-associated protein 1
MSKAAVATNADLLESLPPLVPSIGWRKPQKLDDGGNDANNQTTTTTTSQSTTQPSESSQKPAAGDPVNDDAINNIPSTIKVGNRTIITSKPPRQWAWKSFTSSARHDSAKFFHWVRANIEYADYPYARFDVHLDPLTYTDEEYQKYLAMSEVEDLGETLPDFLTVGKETKADSTTEELSFQQQLLQSNKILPWTKAETDVLMELCQNCDLRWPVIIDRWHLRFKKGTVSSLRKVEDLQYRYYQIGSILGQKRVVAEATKISAASTPGTDVTPPKDTAVDTTLVDASKSMTAASTAQQPVAVESTLPSAEPTLSFPNTGTTNRGKMFDLVAERARRKQLEYIWNQSQDEAQEEAALRAELRAVEAQLRKLKKAGKHLVPSGSAMAAVPPPTEKASTATALTAAPASARPTTTFVPAPPADPFFHAHQEVDESFNETAPVPTPGTPYLQSGRLFPPNIEGHSKLKKSTLKQMDEILCELGVPKEPIATKRSCDLFDGVRKDAMTLLILQKMALRKEAELTEKKAKLEKRKTGAITNVTHEKMNLRKVTQVRQLLHQKDPMRSQKRLIMELPEKPRKRHRKRRERILRLPLLQQQHLSLANLLQIMHLLLLQLQQMPLSQLLLSHHPILPQLHK